MKGCVRQGEAGKLGDFSAWLGFALLCCLHLGTLHYTTLHYTTLTDCAIDTYIHTYRVEGNRYCFVMICDEPVRFLGGGCFSWSVGGRIFVLQI